MPRRSYGNGDGTFQHPANIPTHGGAHSVAIGDFNLDGQLDLATVAPWDHELAILLNNTRQ